MQRFSSLSAQFKPNPVPRDVHSFSKSIIVHTNDILSIIEAEKEITKYKMNFEKCRLESFRNWPISYICVKDLATAGFYYSSRGDRVKCNFCNIEVYEWSCTDSPWLEHQKWSPNCPLITNKITENKSIKPPFGAHSNWF